MNTLKKDSLLVYYEGYDVGKNVIAQKNLCGQPTYWEKAFIVVVVAIMWGHLRKL